MLEWFQALMPREDRFFPMFSRHAATLVAGAEALRDLLNGACSVSDGCDLIVRHEQDADNITAEVLVAVRRSFITPFDRGDIKDLISALDDTIDQMQKTAKAMLIFEVETLQPQMAADGRQIVRAAQLLPRPSSLLGSMRENAARAQHNHRRDHPPRRTLRRSATIRASRRCSATTARQRHGLYHRRRNLRSSGKGHGPLRGRCQPHQRHS